MSKIVDAMLLVLPLIKEMTGQDCLIGLCDTERCLGLWEADSFSLPGGINLGDPIQGFDIITNVIKSGKTFNEKLPAEVLGTPILDIVLPLKEDGQVVGVVLYSSSRVEQVQIQESSKQLSDNISATHNKIENAADGVSELADALSDLQGSSAQLSKQTEKVSELIRGIQATASKSNILALNASIEAARVGEAGRGFAVVADEMGKLAKISGTSAKEISTTLGDIFEHLNGITGSINKANDVAKQQSELIGQINTTIGEISDASQSLVTFAKNQ